MDTEQTDLRGDGNGRTNMHVCIAHGHKQQCGEGQGGGAGWNGAKMGKWGTSVIGSAIKIFFKDNKNT